MQMNTCKTCGGDLHRVGNHYICQSCGNRWTIDAADDVHVVDRANAWAAMRGGEFERAAELFELILEKEPKDHEAFWGIALAGAGIVYVVDYAEHKRVPTCNNIGEESFLNSKNVKKAIENAPKEIADTYRQQAEQIERIRTEWLQKARKEQPYDIFLSYKDSDRENGIDRTQDSVDAQDLYNMLTAEGYRVFFSRISLRDKVSEHYEPYIFNAIRTAKVMIVFGEKAEYFNSTWIRNEWTRFKKRVEDGEKHPNSLIVVCKNMNPGDLPVVLRSRQCLNANDITFGNDLIRHIEKVIEATKGNEHLEKIKITSGQIGKKATAIAQHEVTKREIGQNAEAKTSISEKQSLMLVESYIKEKQWEEADRLLESVLFNNPSFAEAIWCKLLITQKVTSNATLVRILDRFKPEDYGLIEKALNCASREFAGRILDLLYQSCKILSTHVQEKLYALILPYRYERRNQRLRENFLWCISNREFKIFNLLLNALDSEDVDAYIEYNCLYIKSTLDHAEKRECTNKILAVDEGNRVAHMYIFEYELSTATKLKPISDAFENVLKYSENVDMDVEEALLMVTAVLESPLHCEFAQQLPKYYMGNLRSLRRSLMTLAGRMISKSYFDDALAIYNLVLTVDESDADAFWGICLAKTHSSSEEQIVNSPILLNDQPEYTKYLSLVGEERRVQCLRLAKKQQNNRKAKHRKKVRTIVGVAASVVLIAGAVTTVTYILPTVQLNKANELFVNGQYDEANAIYQKLGDFGTSAKSAETVKAILQVEAGNHATAVEALLATGIPVEITYMTEGGSLDALALGHTLSLDGSIIPLSTDAGDDGGETVTLNSIADFTGLLTPTREGYHFAKWETQTFSYDITGQDPVFHMTLKATWSTQEYVINYKLDGGTVNGVNPVEYGIESEDITLIEPTRTGYEFLGWTLGDETEPVKNLVIPTGSYGDRVYTARWKACENRVTFQAEGGMVDINGVLTEIAPLQVIYGEAYVLPVPVKSGYEFIGWEDMSKQSLVTDGVWSSTADLTLTARWMPVEYSVTYHLNGGVNSDDNPDSYTCVDDITLEDPTRKGYVFLGWSVGPDDPAVSREVVLGKGMVGDRIYYARWEAKGSVITFDPNGGTCSMQTLKVTFDAEMTLPVPEKTGHTFLGWYLEGVHVEDGICALEQDCTLVAAWDTVSYTITYALDGGTNAEENPATYTSNVRVELFPPVKVGYTFVGWTTAGQTAPVMEVVIEAGTTEDRSFTAHWEKTQVTVALDANGGTVDSDSLDAVYGDQYELPTPVREGHDFTGWYLAETEFPAVGTWSHTEDFGLVAGWEAKTYSVTFSDIAEKTDGDGWEYVKGTNWTTEYTYGESVVLPTPAREGYTFGGWYADGELVESGAWTLTEDTELTAKWTKKRYTVIVDANGGTINVDGNPATVTVEMVFGEAIVLPEATLEGKTCTWFFREAGEFVDSSDVWVWDRPEAELHIQALWADAT